MALIQTLLWTAIAAAALAAPPSDPAREMIPLPSPRFSPPDSGVLLRDDFGKGLTAWQPDRAGVWSVTHGLLRADLPDQKQERSFIYAGSEDWTDYALDFDVCATRGVDKGAAVRVQEQRGVGLDLRGPGYQDALLHLNEWPLGRAKVINANGVWHHVRLEARGERYRVWVDGVRLLDCRDRRKARPRGRIALAAYTGGVGECTVFYDNVVVTRLR